MDENTFHGLIKGSHPEKIKKKDETDYEKLSIDELKLIKIL